MYRQPGKLAQWQTDDGIFTSQRKDRPWFMTIRSFQMNKKMAEIFRALTLALRISHRARCASVESPQNCYIAIGNEMPLSPCLVSVDRLRRHVFANAPIRTANRVCMGGASNPLIKGIVLILS
jgi:hypothetical protein